MEIYLDNAATTRCREEVRDIVVKTMMEDYGNPSSMHKKGLEAEQYVRQAASRIAETLKVEEREIYFTSGGTESNNWALIGTALANQRSGRHLIISQVEHPAVSAPVEFLEQKGFRVTRLGADKNGRVSPQELAEAVGPDTILVSVMYVNNEIGTVEPIEELGKIIKEKNPDTYFHVDAIQAYGKYRIYPRKLKIDLLSASGHKIYGPKGTGFLYAGKKVKFFPYIYGGGQQQGMRSGTENVPGTAGLGLAAMLAYQDLDNDISRMRTWKEYFIKGLERLDQVTVHSPAGEESAPHIVSASFGGVRSEVLLHTLEEKGIYVSAGSACSAHKKHQSPTLEAIGLPAAQKESAVRFSFSRNTTKEELDITLEVIAQALPVLRRYARR